jgi:hypothetical protein
MPPTATTGTVTLKTNIDAAVQQLEEFKKAWESTSAQIEASEFVFTSAGKQGDRKSVV